MMVIKIGGNVVDDAERRATLLDAIAAKSGPVVLVHGGGKVATELAERMGVVQTMVDGRRITDAETLRIVTMVYGGLINKTLVAELQARGVDAIGLTGVDGDLIRAHKRVHAERDHAR
jgi:acetylglutamate kinase